MEYRENLKCLTFQEIPHSTPLKKKGILNLMALMLLRGNEKIELDNKRQITQLEL